MWLERHLSLWLLDKPIESADREVKCHLVAHLIGVALRASNFQPATLNKAGMINNIKAARVLRMSKSLKGSGMMSEDVARTSSAWGGVA